MTKTVLDVAVVMEHRTLRNRWASEQWEAIGVLPDIGDSEPRRLHQSEEGEQWLFPRQRIELFIDEAENYLLNLTAPQPRVFVMWRPDEDTGLARPAAVTVSYGEAARYMDSGESVDGAPMPAEIRAWVESFARSFYKPEPRKGGRYASARAEQAKPGGRP